MSTIEHRSSFLYSKRPWIWIPLKKRGTHSSDTMCSPFVFVQRTGHAALYFSYVGTHNVFVVQVAGHKVLRLDFLPYRIDFGT